MIWAWLSGLLILLCAHGAWALFTLTGEAYEPLFFLMSIVPAIAALVSAYAAPYGKVMLGTSMAIPNAFLSVAAKWIHELLGNAVDFPGGRGALILFTVTLLYSVILCLLGAIGGYLLPKKSK